MGTSHDTSTDQSNGNGSATRSGYGGRLGTALDASVRPNVAATAPYQSIADQDRGTGGESLANFLGVFSVGLGLAQVLMPGVMSRVVGIDHEDNRNTTLMRFLGLREISHGVAILSNQQPEKAVWSRVAGDAVDLALLGKALTNPENNRSATLFATANVLAVTALDVMCAQLLSKQPETPSQEQANQGLMRVRTSITVGRSVEDVYAFWHNFENFPQFMRHLESVTVMGDRRSHWVAKGPAGKTIEWDAITTDDRENELISWRSAEGSDVYNAGTVRFRSAPGDRGTEVRVEMEYDPPLGKLGTKVASLFRQEPGQQIHDDLRHFKQVMEIGEILFSDATKQPGPHPAQPNEKPIEL
jgi:uncharacterized membrane protein